ncbi:MAG TPA: lipase family protein [Chitinophagales bacterium]|nr:lipase family protein [Chitinophagales bacterium]
MKKITLLLLLAATLPLFALDNPKGHKIVSYTLWKTVSKGELAKKMKDNHVPKSLLKAKYDVDIYDVQYVSHWHDGTEILASGLYFVPLGVNKPMPQVAYHHGTRVQKGRENHIDGESYLCLGLAVDGYLVLKPDYIGLGHGERFHLYQQYKSLGQSTVDFLFAARELNDSLGVKANKQLFLTGYSEGGYAAIAANKVIQESYSKDFTVTAASGNSGAYDMGGVQSEVMFKKYSNPHYLPYILKGFNEVYKIVPNVASIYNPPFDSIIPVMFDSGRRLGDIDKVLPEVPKDMVRDTFVQLYVNDPNFPMRKALADNSLCDWKPENPVQLCYCNNDEQVTYRNSFVARDGMKKQGAKHVTLRNGGKKYGHYKCAIFASMYSKLYFDSFRKGSKYGRKGNAGKRFMLAIARLAIKP